MQDLTSVSGARTNVYFFMISMRAILASMRANLIPMQLRGPQPKGMWQIAGRFAFSSGVNLRKRGREKSLSLQFGGGRNYGEDSTFLGQISLVPSSTLGCSGRVGWELRLILPREWSHHWSQWSSGHGVWSWNKHTGKNVTSAMGSQSHKWHVKAKVTKFIVFV